MKKNELIALGFLLSAGVGRAQTTLHIDMTGNVLDARNGVPIAGAAVSLGNYPNLRTVSEANGDFHLSGNVVAVRPLGPASASGISFEAMDLLGRRLIRSEKALPGYLVLRPREGKRTPSLRLAKAAAEIIDTLKISKAGFRAMVKPITVYNTIFPILLTPKLPAGDLKIFSERAMGQVAWGSNVDVQVWDNSTQLKGDYPVGFEGGHSWMVDFQPYQPFSAWGFVANAATPEDLSDWSAGSMHVAVKGTVPYLAVTMASADQSQGNSVKVDLTQYGYLPDNKWHEVSVPLSDFTGTDLSRVSVYCGFITPAPGDLEPFNSFFYQFDDLYYKLKK